MQQDTRHTGLDGWIRQAGIEDSNFAYVAARVDSKAKRHVSAQQRSSSELVQVAYLYLNADLPYKAAKVMDKGLKDKELQELLKDRARGEKAFELVSI